MSEFRGTALSVCLQGRLISEIAHLMGVEDFLQKQQMIESDIHIVGERVKSVSHQASMFTTEEGPNGSGKQLSATLAGYWLVTACRRSTIELKRLRQANAWSLLACS